MRTLPLGSILTIGEFCSCGEQATTLCTGYLPGNRGEIIQLIYLYANATSKTVSWAAKQGMVQLVRLQLAQQDKDAHDINFAFQLAAEKGHAEVVRFLLQHGADVHAQDYEALRLGASNGHLEVVRLLVEHGANVHADDDWPLRWAVSNGHLEVVRLLLEHGADINALDDGSAL